MPGGGVEVGVLWAQAAEAKARRDASWSCASALVGKMKRAWCVYLLLWEVVYGGGVGWGFG